MKKIIYTVLLLLACVFCGHAAASHSSHRAQESGIFASPQEPASAASNEASAHSLGQWPEASFDACPADELQIGEKRFAAAASLTVLGKEETQDCGWAEAYLRCHASALAAYGHELSGYDEWTSRARELCVGCK